MTTTEILIAGFGFILCAIIFSLICILIMGIVWWMFRMEDGFELNNEEWEEEQ